MRLRDYQAEAMAEVEYHWAAGARNVLVVSPTGSGKTNMFSYMLSKHEGASCAIAHRHELVGQISLTLGRWGVRHGIIAADSTIRNIVRQHMEELGRSWYEPGAQCRVASVDTLVRMNPSDHWLQRVTLWVQDEAHHLAVSRGNGGVVEPNKWAKATGMMPNARGMGVTATPLRADGRGLGRCADGVMDVMVLGPSMRDLINAGFLTDYEIYCPPSDIDLSHVGISASGDFSPEALRDAVKKSHVVGDVVQHYLKIAPGKLGITFAVSIESATEICMEYRAAGVPAEVISSRTDDTLRNTIMRRFKAREIQQVVNVDILGEGVDVPAVEVVSMARPTQSYGLFVQQFGRSLRILPGKERAIIIDHASNVLRHGLPDAPRKWSLDRRERRSKSAPSDAVPLRACPECSRPYERVLPECPYCGHEPQPVIRSSPEAVEGDLFQLSPEVLARMRGEVDAAPKFPHGATLEVTGAIKKRWRERQEAQGGLRAAMEQWGGARRAAGDTDRIMQRRFFVQFGVDVLSAQALPRADAAELEQKVRGVL